MIEEAVYMLNALWFKPGGAEKYAAYAAAASPAVERLGGRRVAAYRGVEALIGDWQPDLLFLVAWPSWTAFTQLAADPEYQRIAHLRAEGLAHSVLLRCDGLA